MKKFEKINRFCSALLLSAFAVAIPFQTKVFASFRVTPLVIESTTKRGQASGIITVTNTGSEVARFRIQASPFTYNRDGFEALTSSPNDLTPFLKFAPREMAIKPGETRRIRLVSRLLPSTKEGEYRAVILTEKLANAAVDNNSSRISAVPRLGVVFYVRHGQATSNLNIQEASYDSEDKAINILAVNSGNASVRPRVNWTLKQDGKTINSGDIESITIIAEGDRFIPIPYPEGVPGQYQVTGEFIWGNSRNRETLPFDVNVEIP